LIVKIVKSERRDFGILTICDIPNRVVPSTRVTTYSSYLVPKLEPSNSSELSICTKHLNYCNKIVIKYFVVIVIDVVIVVVYSINLTKNHDFSTI